MGADLLLVARLVQGFSTGGEYGSAMRSIAEHAPDCRRGFLGSWLEFGILAGYVLGAALVTWLTAVLSPEDLLAWGWRVPFLVARPLGLAGLYLRLWLEETPACGHLERHTLHRDTRMSNELKQIFRSSAPVSGFILAAGGAIAAAAVLLMPETAGKPLPAAPPVLAALGDRA
ncbi:MFS transporter [Dactylosporangium sp. CS-047395]|uniref:MFS transporter n=1 Tax=Dactylosporangium sp. CS-047395 TaxID=3239936 RepID=UPI003D924821